MQFMPGTWASMGVDGDGDGRADIHNDADSVYSAANYLTKSGVSAGAAGVRRAIFAYNHVDWYVNDVLYYATRYGGGTMPGDCREGSGTPNLLSLTGERVAKLLTWAKSHDGDRYRMGAAGPHTWDCSSFTQAAYAHIGIHMPRGATAQRNWLAAGNGTRIQPSQEKPGDLIFWNSYRGPNQIGHVMIIWNPANKTTIEARGTRAGFSYANGPSHHIFEIWPASKPVAPPSKTSRTRSPSDSASGDITSSDECSRSYSTPSRTTVRHLYRPAKTKSRSSSAIVLTLWSGSASRMNRVADRAKMPPAYGSAGLLQRALRSEAIAANPDRNHLGGRSDGGH
jgi:hypothetical protein